MRLDPSWFEGDDPFTQVDKGFARKLAETADPFPAMYLNAWGTEARRGGVKLFMYDGETPLLYEPPRDKCPAIVMMNTDPPPIEAMGEGNRMLTYAKLFEMWIFTRDQSEANQFMWLVFCSLMMPWMQGPDPVGTLPFVHRYFPADSVAPRPWPKDGGGEAPMVGEITINVWMHHPEFPFMRGL